MFEPKTADAALHLSFPQGSWGLSKAWRASAQRAEPKNFQIVLKSSKLNRLDGLASGKRWD